MVIMHGDAPEAVTAANEARMPPEYAGPLRKQRTVNKSGTSTHQVRTDDRMVGCFVCEGGWSRLLVEATRRDPFLVTHPSAYPNQPTNNPHTTPTTPNQPTTHIQYNPPKGGGRDVRGA